jgi:hypothetical protein
MKLTALCIAAAVAATAVLGPVPTLAGETTEARANQLPLRVKDANGKVMGRAAWGNERGYPYIIMQEGKRIFQIAVWPNGADATHLKFRGDSVLYETADCSGQAYLNRDYDYSLQGLSLGTVLLSDGKMTILVAPGISSDIHVQSQRYLDSPCDVFSFQYTGAPVTDTIDITGKYQPPFTIH